jgi:4'-phosphopantetheinyl transferase EntD
MAPALDVIVRIRQLLPAGAVIKGGDVNQTWGPLFQEEETLIASAIDKRRREFAAGRIYARHALQELGHPAVPILPGPSRAPQWPKGFVGTISHSESICAAIVARTTEISSIGLDIENDGPLGSDLASLVCCPVELSQRSGIETRTGIDLPKLLFVIKEAFYKAYHPVTGSFLEFLDVEVCVDPTSFTFDVYLVKDCRPSFLGKRRIEGRFGLHGKLLFALSHLSAGTSRT